MIEKKFDGDDTKELLPICDFSREWLGIEPNLFQRVILKLFVGEDLSVEVIPPYDVSEDEWLDLMIKRGRFPYDMRRRIEARKGMGFENINLTVGRRGSKTLTSAIATFYTIYRLLRMPNPQAHYKIMESEPIIVAVAATSEEQANEAPFAKISAICREAVNNGSPLADYIARDGIKSDVIYFQTEHDRELAKNKKLKGTRNASVQVRSYHTNQKTLRGGSIITAIFDELAWFPITPIEDKGRTYYTALTAAMHQFGKDGRAFTLSSPGYQYGLFHDMYKAAWQGGLLKTVSVHMPSWEVWEFEPPHRRHVTKKGLADDDRLEDFVWNYEEGETWEEAYERATPSFKREFGAEFEGAEEQWLSPYVIDRCFKPHLSMRDFGIGGRYYVAAADAGYADDAFAFAIAHREGEAVIIDHLWRWFVAPDRRYVPYKHLETVYYRYSEDPAYVDTTEAYEHIKNMLKRFGVMRLTFDQRESRFMVQELAIWCRKNGLKTSVTVKDQTKTLNEVRGTTFKKTLLEDNVHCFENSLLRTELLGLQKDKQGRIGKSPYSKDDMYDVVSRCIEMALDAPELIGHTRRGKSIQLTPVVPRVRM